MLLAEVMCVTSWLTGDHLKHSLFSVQHGITFMMVTAQFSWISVSVMSKAPLSTMTDIEHKQEKEKTCLFQATEN